MENIEDLVNEWIDKANLERGNISILVAGRSGVGKSTLINSVFQEDLAVTGQGRPITQNTREFYKEGFPLRLLDTRGLEMSGFQETLQELETVLRDRSQDPDPERHIHVAWLCVHEDGRRVEEAEVSLHKLLARHMPVITVITKSRNDNGFSKEVSELLPLSKNVVRVRALREQLDEGFTLEQMGLEKLIEATSMAVPEGKQRALAAVQKANLEIKQREANKVIVKAASVAAAIGAAPIPFSSAALLAPVQVAMIARISSIFGEEVSKGHLTTVISAVGGWGGATLTGQLLVGSLLKLIPGIGSIAGGAISATTAGAVTTALGKGYVLVMIKKSVENPSKTLAAKEISELLVSALKRKV